ncbi:hypothetical protein SFC50_20400 [Bacillus infantis]
MADRKTRSGYALSAVYPIMLHHLLCSRLTIPVASMLMREAGRTNDYSV